MNPRFYCFALLSFALCLFRPCLAQDFSLSDRIKQIRANVHARIKPHFARQRVAYPPARLLYVAVKDENRFKVFARDNPTTSWRFIHQYEIAKLSGKPGPKLRSGDKQVPEGLYRVTHLNPNSKFWLSLALNYPNAFDRKQARTDNRKSLGGDIMLHGWWFSEGCVALGNNAIEDVFLMSHETGLDNVSVLISPTDFRHSTDPSKLPQEPNWTKQLYKDIEDEFNELGTDGMTTDTRLVSYADIAPPPPPAPSNVLEKILRALSEAAETSNSLQNKLK